MKKVKKIKKILPSLSHKKTNNRGVHTHIHSHKAHLDTHFLSQKKMMAEVRHFPLPHYHQNLHHTSHHLNHQMAHPSVDPQEEDSPCKDLLR